MNDDTNLIDISMLQQLQDQFCCADHLYLMCVDKNKGVVTKPFGTEEQVEFLRTQVDKHAYMELVDQMQHDRMETVVERETAQDFMKLCAVSTKVEDQLQVVWIVMGIIKERLTPEVHLPEGMLITTEEQFYASVEFLSLLSGQLFESRRNQMIAQKAVEKSSVSELAMEYQLHRSRAMTEILQMMDSDNSFEKVAEDILREACESLEISGGCLLRENTGENTADMICEYTKEPDKSILAEGQHIPIGALPFYNGKTYMISCRNRLHIYLKPVISVPEFLNRLKYKTARRCIFACMIMKKQESGRTEISNLSVMCEELCRASCLKELQRIRWQVPIHL